MGKVGRVKGKLKNSGALGHYEIWIAWEGNASSEL